MFASNYLTTSCLLMLATLFVARQTVCDKLESNHVSISTTSPTSGPTSVEVIPAPVVHNSLGSSQPQVSLTTSPPNSKIDAKLHPAVTVVPSSLAPAVHAPSLTPTVAAKVASHPVATIAANTTTATVTDQTPGQRLAQYFEPICNHLDKLLPEHIFKIQSQMKQFVEKTAGKMSVCFMQYFMIDPNLKPVDKTQLASICSSEKSSADAKSSFRNFQACAEHNWDKNLDQDLERIIRLRLNCFFNHSHSVNDSTVSLVHDSDDISLIGEVVGKVLNNNNNSKSESIGKANITMIDVGPAPSKAPASVAATGGNGNKTVAPHTTPAANLHAASSRNILNDPNTLLVFVDDSSQTTKAPVKVATPTPVATHTIKITPVKTTPAPVVAVVVTTSKPTPKDAVATNAPHPMLKNETHSPVDVKIATIPNTSAKPATTVLGEKILGAVSTRVPTLPVKVVAMQPTTSSKPTLVVVASTAKPTKPPVVVTTPPSSASKNQLLAVVVSTIAPIKVSKIIANASTTIKPAMPVLVVASAKPSTTTGKPQATPTKSVSAKPSSTGKPVILLETAPKKSDMDKHDLNTKIKDEHDKKMSQLKKEQDENDAKNAIKALQKQRAGHVADARMHQIEHERQMTIDPMGHTLKHQRYEQIKQQRTSTTQAPSSSKKS